jgi:hypothetical protein
MTDAPSTRTRIDAHFVAAGKYHDIDFARLEVLKLLGDRPNIRTTVACDYADIARLDACSFLISYTCDVMPSEAETAAIRAWLDRGGRWLALHGTNSILEFTESGVSTPALRPDVMDLLGTQFKAHPPIGPFRVEVVERDHDLTRGIEDFDVVDELYLSETLSSIRVLMQTRFTGEATGFVDADSISARHWRRADPLQYARPLPRPFRPADAAALLRPPRALCVELPGLLRAAAARPALGNGELSDGYAALPGGRCLPAGSADIPRRPSACPYS